MYGTMNICLVSSKFISPTQWQH